MYSKDFLWGAATSSHQVEGSNTNNDWWLWEQQGKVPEPSCEATRHYELFDHDFQLAKELHHNAHRFSIEWSRIEPTQNRFDDAAIEHYRQMIRSLKTRSIEPVVTLHHFTNPLWFHHEGGWLNNRSSIWFSRYAQRVVEALGQDVHYWVTINEPMVLVFYSYLTGVWPPGRKSVIQAWKAVQNLIRAHRAVYYKIHEIYAGHRWERPEVGLAKNLRPFHVCPQSQNFFCRLGVFLRHRLYNLYFLEKTKSMIDFIGANYYEREYVSNDRSSSFGLLGNNCNQAHHHSSHCNQMGWDYYPEGFFEVLCWLKKYRKPVLVTENGTCEEEDEFRWRFIDEHLKQMGKAIKAGVPVIGYLYWSLLDNFEWHHGFDPRFGLIEVDYSTFQRTVRPSAFRLRDIIDAEEGGNGP